MSDAITAQPVMPATHRSWPAIATVYAASLLQGLTLVSFPASATVLRQMHGLTDTQYGSIFLPQVGLAVVGAISGGFLARRLGLKRLLWIALLANALSQLCLALTAVVMPSVAYPLLLAGTACLGFGFGLSGAPLNSYPPQFFPGRSSTAIVALHSLLGLGLMLGPLLLTVFVSQQAWPCFPLLLLASCLGLALTSWLLPLSESEAAISTQTQAVSGLSPARSPSFWIFVCIAVLYAFAEGTFSNWAVVYLQEAKNQPAAVAAAALSVFWGAMVVGRLLASALVLRVPAQTIWLFLPVVMLLTFLLLPSVSSPQAGIVLFALAGLGCSAFFPLSIAIISNRFPAHIAWSSSMLIAALMVGVGLGSFVVGALRTMLPLEQLYLLSACYPLLVLVLGIGMVWRGALRPTAQASTSGAFVSLDPR